MLRALWFLVKVAALIAVVVWVASQPGQIDAAWLGYKIKVDMGLFLLAALGFVLLSIVVYQAIRSVFSFPQRLRAQSKIKARDKGYRALTLGLSAVAAGDTRTASTQARRAEKLLDGHSGLTMLLKAQAARLEGREDDALQSFVALLNDKDTAFLGVRGLLQSALDDGDYKHALELAQRAQKIHPRQPWILRVVYDLEIRLHHWERALEMLKNMRRVGAMDADKARSDEAAILIVQADAALEAGRPDQAERALKKALKVAPEFSPPVGRLVHIYLQSGQKKKARRVVESAWKRAPHPDLLTLWAGFDGVKPLGEVGEADAEKAWICCETGRVYEQYSPIALPHGSFNTIRWAKPDLIDMPVMPPTSLAYDILEAHN